MSKNALRRAAEIIRKQGERKDTVLAHISPAEAKFLKENFGGDKNPVTGLPQFGLLRSVKKPFKKVEKALRRPWKVAAPIIGSAVGMALGGPQGAVIGGSIGKSATSRHKKNLLKNAFQGALIGATYGSVAPGVGEFAGVTPSDALGQMMGVGRPGLLSTLGLSPGATKAASMMRQPTEKGLMEAVKEKASSMDMKDWLTLGTIGTMVAGALKGKSKYHPYEGPSVPQIMAQHGLSKHPYVPLRRVKPPKSRELPIKNPEAFSPEGYQQRYFADMPEPEYYAGGGPVREGYIAGADGGQSDKRDAHMPVGSYVHDATTISLYGDGNTENGVRKLNELKEIFDRAADEHGYAEGGEIKMMPAMVSDGELIWEPKTVYGAGILVDGDPGKGPKVLDRFRHNLRKQKGVKPFLPPKSKHAGYYFKGAK